MGRPLAMGSAGGSGATKGMPSSNTAARSTGSSQRTCAGPTTTSMLRCSRTRPVRALRAASLVAGVPADDRKAATREPAALDRLVGTYKDSDGDSWIVRRKGITSRWRPDLPRVRSLRPPFAPTVSSTATTSAISGSRRRPRARSRLSGSTSTSGRSREPSARSDLLKPLADCQDVSLGVLEPGRLGAASGRDAVLHRRARHVVLLELDAPLLELRHFGLHVLDLPVRLACLGRARIGRRVQKDFGASAFIDHAARVVLPGYEPNGLLVELPRPRDVGSGDVSANRCSSQHDGSSVRSS